MMWNKSIASEVLAGQDFEVARKEAGLRNAEGPPEGGNVFLRKEPVLGVEYPRVKQRAASRFPS